MSDTTPNDGNWNPETDAPATTLEPGAPEDTGYDTTANAPADAGRAEPTRYSEPTGYSDATGYTGYTDAPGYTGTGSHSAVAAEPAAEQALTQPTAPIAPEPVQRDYVPAATIGAAGATGAVPLARDYPPTERYPETTAAQANQVPIYVTAPAAPRNRGNRGAGAGIALLATVVYAALYALVAFIIVGVTSTSLPDATTKFAEFIVRPVFYIPIIFFFLALTLLVAIVNRGGWWAYVLFGFLVAAAVYFSYIGGALLTVQAWTLTPADAVTFVSRQWLNPGAIAAAVIAREVTIWAGAWIARNGRRVTARNVEARQDYERQLAEGPQLTR